MTGMRVFLAPSPSTLLRQTQNDPQRAAGQVLSEKD